MSAVLTAAVRRRAAATGEVCSNPAVWRLSSQLRALRVAVPPRLSGVLLVRSKTSMGRVAIGGAISQPSPPISSARARRKAALVVSDRARERLAVILAARRARAPDNPPTAVRLGLEKRGCNGLSYTLNYATDEEILPVDEVVEVDDAVKIVIDPQALLSVVGTEMDWEESYLTSEFVFTNPNAKSLCGCKESFSL